MIEPKKSLGQHWLNDRNSLMEICEAANVSSGDEVLEIGPGKGSLTSVLLEEGAKVFAVEFDPSAIQYLEQKFSKELDSVLRIEPGDIRTFDLTRMPAGYKIVANIPYYLTSHLIQIFSESSNPPSSAVLLIQKEVAERVAAGPGKMSLLGITAQFYWEASLAQVIKAKLFDPIPNVDSQILILNRRDSLPFDVEPKKFFRLVKSGFASKRKTLLNSLSGGLRIGKGETLGILEASKIDPKKRPQDLSLSDWNQIYKQALLVGVL